MLVRIVKMSFSEEHIDEFLKNFNLQKENIRHFGGCQFLELYRDKQNTNVFFTYRVHSHVLNDETYCLFRLRNLKTGRRSEKVYKSKRHALEFLKNTALEGKYEITMVTDDLVETYDPLMQAVDIDELF